MRTEYRNGEPQIARHYAVIGSGVAGLSAAWLLAQHHRVTLFEADGRPGGHSNTVLAPTGDTLTPVDTGFIVFNERNYPNLTALFEHLGVKTQRSDMSFAASLDGGRLEYSSDGLNGLLGQRSNSVSLRFWTMVRDIWRFYSEAPKVVKSVSAERMTLGEFLDANNYSAAFVEDHLLPMGAAIWSTTAKQMRDYPLVAFVRFFVHHGLLDLIGRPNWRTVSGGSIKYVQAMLSRIGEVRCGAGVAQVLRERGGATVVDVHGQRQHFTDVVIATHADEALKLLGDADEQERRLLGAFAYTDNEAVLHSDTELMPKRQGVWASWNYIGETCGDGDRPLCVTYWMNRLQGIDPATPLFVTLNPRRDIPEERIIAEVDYEHPLFDPAALAAQKELWRLQGRDGVWFCGAHFGSGFHEDGLQSGLSVAEAICGQRRPWSVENESGRIPSTTSLAMAQ